MHVYRHVPASVQGPGLKLVGAQSGPPGATPLTLCSGTLTWHLPDGAIRQQLLSTHSHMEEASAPERSNSGKGQLGAAQGGAEGGAGAAHEERLAARCQQALVLGHFPRALDAARALGDAQLLREVALAALQFFELNVAVAAYEAAGDEGALAQLRPLEAMRHDGNLLMGHLVAIAGGEAAAAHQLRRAGPSQWRVALRGRQPRHSTSRRPLYVCGARPAAPERHLPS